jgi:hypothetical protein
MFHSRVYGAMHKRQRRRLGLAGHRREEVWRMMAEQEAQLAAAAGLRFRRWWRRLLDWAWLRLVWLRVRLFGGGRRHRPSRAASAPHSATDAAAQSGGQQ